MPRFLPKLIQNIRIAGQHGSKLKQVVNRLSAGPRKSERFRTESSDFSLSPHYWHSRQTSIVMEDNSPIGRRAGSQFKKKRAPIIPTVMRPFRSNLQIQQPNHMSEQECRVWANPYLRMLGSPIRRCLLTDSQLPNDFLIKIAALQVSSPNISRSVVSLFPDRIEHPRFRQPSSGNGGYVVCHKESVKEMVKAKGKYHRIPSPSRIQVHSLFLEQIEYQLQMRVVQELELLAERLRCAPQTSLDHTAIRRLKKQEWEELKATNQISYPGAVAILVVPPVRKSPESPEQRPINSQSDSTPAPSLRPPSQLYDSGHIEFALKSDSKRQIPLYNGASLFPFRDVRIKLHQALTTVVTMERQARWRQRLKVPNSSESPAKEKRDELKTKSSYAYLLRSDFQVVRRADTVPLAIALWRLRLWNGQGWEDELAVMRSWPTKIVLASRNQ